MKHVLGKIKVVGLLVVQLVLDWIAKTASWSVRGKIADRPLLLIRTDAIGDFIVWLGSAKRLISRQGSSRTVLVCNLVYADLAENCGLFDQVVGLDVGRFTSDWKYRFRVIRGVRSLNAALAIQPTYSRKFWVGDSLVRASGARARIGYDGDLHVIRSWQKRISDCWYTKLVPAQVGPVHELIRNADFLKGLGDEHAVPEIAQLNRVSDLPRALRSMEQYLICVPGAGSSRRMWPVERFAELAANLAEKHHLKLVVCGSLGERDLAEELCQQSKVEQALNLAGLTSLPEMVEAIRKAQLVVANDSSAVHIAAAVDTPSLCLLGGGHFGRFLPYPKNLKGMVPEAIHAEMPCFGCNWDCTQPHKESGPYPCLEKISVAEAIGHKATDLALKKA